MFMYWRKRGAYELEPLPSSLTQLGMDRFSWSSSLEVIYDVHGKGVFSYTNLFQLGTGTNRIIELFFFEAKTIQYIYIDIHACTQLGFFMCFLFCIKCQCRFNENPPSILDLFALVHLHPV